MKENKERVPWIRSFSDRVHRMIAGAAPIPSRSSTRTPRKSSPSTAITATCAPTSACPSSKCSRIRRQENALGRAAHPDHRRAALQGRQLRCRRQHRRQTEFLKPLFKLKSGDYYGEKRIRKGWRRRAKLRHRRLLRVHGFPDYKFHDDPNPNEPEVPECAQRRLPTRKNRPVRPSST
jgi:hypothetical protein